VTQTELYYEGSLTLDEELFEKADILAYEQVQVLNVNNGERFETYALPGKRGSHVVCLNGPAARSGEVGDEIIIITYATYDQVESRGHKPKVVLLDKRNNIKRVIEGHLEVILKKKD
jgi:aspartate 1-decarboxylase